MEETHIKACAIISLVVTIIAAWRGEFAAAVCFAVGFMFFGLLWYSGSG